MKRSEANPSPAADIVPEGENPPPSLMPKALHRLSNKLLPIVAFSDLGCRRCEDPQLREYFDKIRRAAADARDLIVELRQGLQRNE